MRIKKSIKDMLDRYDEQNPYLPKRFYNYISKIKRSHRLIIKYKNKNYKCGNCSYEFSTKNNFKVDTYHKCPNCKGKFLIKTAKLRHYKMYDDFAILTKFEDKFIIRAFEVETMYKNGEYRSHTCEYARLTYDKYLRQISEAYNGNISATISGKFVNHSSFMNNDWKENGSYYHTIGEVYKLYPYNLKKTLKGTQWEYCQIDKYAKKIEYFNIIDFLHASSNKTELLIKSGLYNIVYDYIRGRHYYNLPNLDHKFIKNNLKYIRKHKLNYKETAVFQYTMLEDIKLIKKYGRYDLDYNVLKKYNINLKFANKNIRFLSNNLSEYYDYLRLADKLGYDLKNKKILYPQNLLKLHDKLVKEYKVNENKIIQKKIADVYKKIKRTEYSDKKYIIFPAKSIKELENESKQQHNCVKTYAERIADGECNIYFMRLVDERKKSLVTVEVRNNQIVQQRTKYNKSTTQEQKDFLKIWEKEILCKNI